ncbi:nostrin-like isoform X1 [Dreissena polymorpha]|uniref:Nostrin n=1 Tax=Dreissena polymorpha TaxID=45954 RepID=A0A9D4C4D1_DREPO|nr:nostrin-like isoform X1 [Dreissena polymorpha]KAH3716919.1 hypothetical protein DPMN_059653 [Dreissena polymorpha]
MGSHHHRHCSHCHTCREQGHSHMFGPISHMIPGHWQSWISAQIQTPEETERVAKGVLGFEELKKYMRQGNEFCKEVALLIHERADLETKYHKGLSIIAAKLSKVAQTSIGTLGEGWKAVAASIDTEADLHRNLATAMLEEIAKPLKHLVAGQKEARRPIEEHVEKSLKSLTEKRNDEIKAKKSAYDTAKSHEKVEEPKNIKTDKDANKTEKKQKQVLDRLRKADKAYCECCEKAEVARQEWEFTVNKANVQLQTLDEERISKMNDFLNLYNSHLSVLGPRLSQCCDTLLKSVQQVDVSGDISLVAKTKGSQTATPEQMLIDCYAEDSQFTMKKERRKMALQHYLLHIRQSIEREQKGREGVEKLVGVYKERPNFADQDAQEDTRQRLTQVIFMMNFLEANHYKIATSLASIDGGHKPAFKFSKYIEQARDKQGMLVSLLKLPPNLASAGDSGYDATSVTLSSLATVGMDDNIDDDEFDDPPSPTGMLGRCRAIFDYQAVEHGDLAIHTGDIINITEKLGNGWWQGECNGRSGVFPESYVQEL